MNTLLILSDIAWGHYFYFLIGFVFLSIIRERKINQFGPEISTLHIRYRLALHLMTLLSHLLL